LDLNTRQERRFTASIPLVTIVTPCFNSAAFIEHTINSVANQTYSRIEHIVVDAGSTDGTVDIIKRNEKSISLWVSEPDAGQADAIRKGFFMSSGEILAWINADDVYPEDAVETAVAELLRSPVDVVYGNRGLIDSEGQRIGERRLTPFLSHFSRKGMLYGGFGVYQPASFWRRDLYFDVGGIDPSFQFSMDTDLFVRFAMADAHFEFIPKELVQFRVHASSKTSTSQDVAREEWRRISASVPPRQFWYRWFIRTVCRSWKVFYHLKESRGRYLFKLLTDRQYRFVP
jgi:glycosyltransferase involved in cell wall biosynthesis